MSSHDNAAETGTPAPDGAAPVEPTAGAVPAAGDAPAAPATPAPEAPQAEEPAPSSGINKQAVLLAAAKSEIVKLNAANAGLAAANEQLRASNAELSAGHGELAASNADLKDRLVRTLAEMDNLRKRTEREKADVRKYAISDFARDVLGIGDNIQRAINHVPKEDAEKDPALQSFLEGVQLLERELLSILERHGVSRIIPDNEPFNPHLHQAVMEEENAALPAGTVMQVFQAGFMIADRCLRPAVVSISRGGPKGAKPEAANDVAPPATGEPRDDAGTAQDTDPAPPQGG